MCYYIKCDTKCQADSARGCPSGTHWDSAECTCKPDPVSSSSQAESSSSSEPESSSSVDCTGSRSCCDSLNTHRPVEYDTLDLGCGSVQAGDNIEISACEEQHSYYLDGSVAQTYYMCNGVFYQRICATEYVYDGTGNCEPLPSTDCWEITNWDKSSTECQNIRCDEVWHNELHDVSMNNATKCYEGRYRLMLYLVCSNGSRTKPSYGEFHPYKVCEPYLDSLGQDFPTYVGGNSPGGPGVDGNGNPVDNSGGLGLNGSGGSGGYGGSGGGVSGGGTGGGSSGGASGGGTSGGTGGGQGVGDDEALGDLPANAYIPLTETDSLGNVTTVKNSQGGDSLVPYVKTYDARCIAVSNGVATMTDGTNYWTCSGVQSCIQAELKYKLGQGCGTMSTPSDPVPVTPSVAWTDSVTHSSGTVDYTDAMNNMSRTATWFYNFFAFPSQYTSFAQAVNAVVGAVNGGTELSRRQRDSLYTVSKNELWKTVFGNDLSNVSVIRDSAARAVQVMKEVKDAVDGSATATATSVSQASSDVVTAIGNAQQNIRNTVSSSVGSVENTLMSYSGRLGDTLHNVSFSTERIALMLDTGGIIQEDLTFMRDTIHSLHATVSDYMGMITEHNSLMGNLTANLRDSVGETNSILRDIRDAMGATPPPSSSASPASSSAWPMAEADSSYADSLEYELDLDIAADSVVSARMTDSLSGLSSRAADARRSLDSTIAHVDSVRAADNNNWIAMDSIYKWHRDTTKIRQKLPGLFLPSQVSNNCFVCTYNEKWGRFDVDLRFDAGNVYGFNLCEFIRLLVRVGVTIFILFSTISAFIRAFGGGGGGGN